MGAYDRALAKSLEAMNLRTGSTGAFEAVSGFEELSKSFGQAHFPKLMQKKVEDLKKSHCQGELSEEEFMESLNALERMAKQWALENKA